MPYIAAAGEIKTKPTQHTVKEMLSIGLQPDILICRMDREMPADERRKIALFCNVEERAIVGSYDVGSITNALKCCTTKALTALLPSSSN